ncbi:MAG: hypothetical protein A2W98_00945 [Bacteroidetes bacterium GWF2_33_38]|nr:MAG: hypothetical protein A2W98_00945 [Bacteroidetes bacterium GWF2_33_38]OFY68440.1 MAG: hypothetical protein A2265_06795 [Bacteroidetes bacterium RIFOXYA12_FULL_33_9]HBX50639.1 hypothetical protein [Bacteroidales bacterium]
MKTIQILVSLFIIATMFSCKHKKECPAFKESDLTHVTYSEYDTLKFVNQQSEEYYIYLQNFILSDAFEDECVDLYGICPCINYVEVMAKNSTSMSPYVFLRMEQSDVSDMRYFKYKVQDFDFEIDFDNEVQYVDDFPYMDLLDTITIQNTLYHNVIVYSNLENANSDVFKVYLNKANGIIRIHEKDNTIWDKLN